MTLPPLSRDQQTMIDFALDRKGSAWFAPPGFGKTRSWLEVIDQTPGRTLVIAPKLVCLNTWPREHKKWGYDSQFSMRFLHGRDRHLRRLPDVSLINYEAVPWLAEELRGCRQFPFEFVVYDELSKMKNPESKRFQAWEGVVDRFKYRSGGTGTPVGAHLRDLWGEMYVCDLGETLGENRDRFMGYYFHHNAYTNAYEAYSDAETEILERIKPNAISFDINDLDLPPLSHHPVWLDLPDEAREYYEMMHSASFVEELDVSACNAAVRSGKLRQLASGGVIDDQGGRKYLHDAKSERLAGIADELQGEPMMIFFEYLSDYVSICRTLKREVPALHGATTMKQANRYIEQWNRGELPFLALHSRSGSHGLNLQGSGRVIVFYTCPWSGELLHQGIGRLWRQGQTNKVLVYYLGIRGTIDETVLARVNERMSTNQRVIQALL